MNISYNLGKIGEDAAEIYLLNLGYKIIDRHFYCKQGEIDIIAKDKNEFVFIEVKARSNRNFGNPVDSVTYYKKNHLIKAIRYYLYLKKMENSFIRIDIIEVYQYKDGLKINHIKKAIF